MKRTLRAGIVSLIFAVSITITHAQKVIVTTNDVVIMYKKFRQLPSYAELQSKLTTKGLTYEARFLSLLFRRLHICRYDDTIKQNYPKIRPKDEQANPKQGGGENHVNLLEVIGYLSQFNEDEIRKTETARHLILFTTQALYRILTSYAWMKDDNRPDAQLFKDQVNKFFKPFETYIPWSDNYIQNEEEKKKLDPKQSKLEGNSSDISFIEPNNKLYSKVSESVLGLIDSYNEHLKYSKEGQPVKPKNMKRTLLFSLGGISLVVIGFFLGVLTRGKRKEKELLPLPLEEEEDIEKSNDELESEEKKENEITPSEGNISNEPLTASESEKGM